MFSVSRGFTPAHKGLLHISMQSRLYHHPGNRGPAASTRSRVHLVVEPSPKRSLAADCPIHIFSSIRTYRFQLRCSNVTLRVFQQFDGLHSNIAIRRFLVTKIFPVGAFLRTQLQLHVVLRFRTCPSDRRRHLIRHRSCGTLN